MKANSFFLAVALLPLSVGSAPAATVAGVISDGGTSLPSTNILLGNSAARTGLRPVDYTSSTKHSARGQSFTMPTVESSYIVNAIWVRLDAPEDFSVWSTNSLHLNFLSDPTTRNAAPLGSFSYNATGLNVSGSSVADESWLRFELDSGITVAGGTEYSFLLTAGEQNAAHLMNLSRNNGPTEYTEGSELNGGNLYDIANRETDPWDDTAPIGGTVGTTASNLFFYVEGVAVPEPSGTALLLLSGLGLLLRRRRH